MLAAALFGLFLALYWQATGYGFLNYLENTAFLAHPEVAGSQRLAWAFSAGIPWEPLSWISHMVDFALFGNKGGAHRTVSVMLHVLNVLLVFVAFRKLTGAMAPSLATALLWGVHPMRVEPVVWLVERRMLLATTFVLLALAAYPGFLAQPGKWWRRLALWIPALLAALSHPVGAVLPVLLLVVDAWPLGRRGSLMEKLPLWAISLATVGMVARGAAQPESAWILGAASLVERIAAGLRALLLEAPGKTVLPHPLASLYWNVDGAPMIAAAVGSVAVVAAAARWKAVRLGAIWFVAALVPTLGFIHPELAAWGDRGTYLAHVGLIAGLVWAGLEFGPRARVAALAVGLAWAGLTWARIPTWQSTESALRTTVEYGGGHPLARYLLAQFHIAQNMGVDAERELLEVLKDRPRAIEARLLLGSALALQQRFKEGADVYREVIRQAPARPEGYYGLGMMQTNLRELMPGIESFGEAIKRGLPPVQEATAENAIALYWLGEKNWTLAEQHARRAWQQAPAFANAHRNYATALAQQGKTRPAFAHLERARLWTKDDPQVIEIWTQLFNTLAMEEKKRIEAEESQKK